MTLTTLSGLMPLTVVFQMPVRSMTLTTTQTQLDDDLTFQMPVRSMTLTTTMYLNHWGI